MIAIALFLLVASGFIFVGFLIAIVINFPEAVVATLLQSPAGKAPRWSTLFAVIIGVVLFVLFGFAVREWNILNQPENAEWLRWLAVAVAAGWVVAAVLITRWLVLKIPSARDPRPQFPMSEKAIVRQHETTPSRKSGGP